jgi:hypothetical protein
VSHTAGIVLPSPDGGGEMKQVVACVLLVAGMAVAVCGQQKSWTFAVSGDSRNCGDIVMPLIAADAASNKAEFYWHLGDLRATYDFDQDILARRDRSGTRSKLTISDYFRTEWDDFIQHQVAPFKMPMFVGIGNHETAAPKDRNQFVIQFADWLDSPVLQQQRLADDPADRKLRSYFHWIRDGVDFIYLDNATTDQLDRAQLAWFEGVLKRDTSNSAIKTLVVGMHVPLPDSLSLAHSMSDWPLGEQSGRRVYQDLLRMQNEAKKHVYVLASHSHFLMGGIFNSEYLRNHGGVLPGWIVGTAGATRYALPPDAAQAELAKTNLYGYLLGTVAADHTIRFDFHEVTERDLDAALAAQYPPDAMHECFAGNGPRQ